MSMERLMSLAAHNVHLLSLVDIFSPLSPEEIQRLDEQISEVHLEQGDISYCPEDSNERVFILQSGRMRLFKVVDDRELTLDVVGAGTMFGEGALTAQRVRETYAQAMEPSDVCVMTSDQLERLIVERPEVGVQIVHLLSERLRRYETRLGDITLKDVLARLASLILSLVDSEGVVTRASQLKIPNHYTHQQLGTMIGATREAVTRAFTRLQDEGVVELRRRLIHVADADALKQLARSGDHGEDPDARSL